MFWADFAIGLGALRDRILAYQKQLGGAHWEPAALLTRVADQGKSLTGYVSTLSPDAVYGPRARP